MSEVDPPTTTRRGRVSRGASITAKTLVGILIAALVALAGLFLFLDTDPGRRLIADRIAALEPASGLRIRIGRIEGSVWGDARLIDVRLYDERGLFAESPDIRLDWRPTAWIGKRLVIDELVSPLVVVHRVPRLRPSDDPRPILPDFDIRVGRLQIDRLRFEPGIVGERRIATLSGEADVRAGRALVRLDGAMVNGGDRLRLLLDAEPDRDRLDLDVKLTAPERSVLGAMLGTRQAIALDVSGAGSWSKWQGRALLDYAGRRSAVVALVAQDGRYAVSGTAAPAPFLRGRLQRLSSARVAIRGSATFEDRVLDGRLTLRSDALRLVGRGGIDLGVGAFDDVRVALELLRPAALFPKMSGERVRGSVLLDGAFGRARFAYRLTSRYSVFDKTGFRDMRAEGSGRWSPYPVAIPVRVTAREVTGEGPVAAEILRNLRVDGVLRLTTNRLTGQDLRVVSDRVRARAILFVNLDNGYFDVALTGMLQRYLIPGLGIVDVTTDLKVVEGPNKRGSILTGRGTAIVRRFDNEFLLGLAGGLPRLETELYRGIDKILRFRNLRITAPKLRIMGEGYRRLDDTYVFEGRGQHEDYGPFTIALDGPIERPQLRLLFERPNDGMQLSDVLLELDPNPDGYVYRANGGSALGPFTSNGAILLPGPRESSTFAGTRSRGAPATIRIAALDVSGTRARGDLVADAGALAGTLQVAGGGLDGRLLLGAVGGNQRIEVRLNANDARFAGPPPLTIRRGRIEGVVLLDPAGTSIEGSLNATGLRRGEITLARIEATASLRGGRGQVKANITGTRGRSFVFRTVADIAPDTIRLTGQGSVDRRPIALSEPAVLTRAEGGWRLAPTALTFAGGNATVAGLFGAQRTEYEARLQAMPLTVLDIFFPELGLGGIASGTLAYRDASAGSAPTGDANLRIRGLTRSGLVLTSRPVDIGLVARLDGRNAALRAVATSEGRTIGRAQARVSPIGASGSFADRIARAPLFAQLRYNGAADTLWRLTGLELLDLSGPVAIGADARGTLNDPQIRGSLSTSGARLESAVTGTVLSNVAARGRFAGSRLAIDSFTGTAGEGNVSGRGVFDFSAARGVGMNLALTADRAELLDRDDLQAVVTGPLSIRSDGAGGTVAGQLQLVSGRFRLGRASAAEDVARLPVRELNRRAEEADPAPPQQPWRLDLAVRGDDQLRVTGLGLNSEWGANLRIRGRVDAPRITGDAELIDGTYDFAGRRFDLARGTIRFQGETPVNPVLDIVAEGGVQGLNATIRVTGRGQAPEIAFSSTPALPQDELLSRLLFGTSITNLSAPEALQLAAAVASLNETGPSLDPINAVRTATGLDRLRILPADISTGQGTAIAAGKYLGRRVYVEVITDGRGYSATQVEYQVTRWLSILSSISTIGRESVNVRVSRDY